VLDNLGRRGAARAGAFFDAPNNKQALDEGFPPRHVMATRCDPWSVMQGFGGA